MPVTSGKKGRHIDCYPLHGFERNLYVFPLPLLFDLADEQIIILSFAIISSTITTMSRPESLLEPGEDILNELYDTVLRGFRPISVANLTQDLITSTYAEGTERSDSSRATFGSIQRTLSCEYSSQLIVGL